MKSTQNHQAAAEHVQVSHSPLKGCKIAPRIALASWACRDIAPLPPARRRWKWQVLDSNTVDAGPFLCTTL